LEARGSKVLWAKALSQAVF